MSEEMIKKIRTLLMDSLLSRNGVQLTPDVVSEITSELMTRIDDLNIEGVENDGG